MTLYHCTWTRLVPRIAKQGLRLLQTSNWIDGAGKRQGGGAIFAFESYWDAVRWAARMEWDHKRSHGAGHVSILTINRTGEWDTDHADPLSQAICEGAWLKAFHPVAAADVVSIQPLTQDMVRALVAHQNEAWANQEVK
jgi:hypothetical protein